MKISKNIKLIKSAEREIKEILAAGEQIKSGKFYVGNLKDILRKRKMKTKIDNTKKLRDATLVFLTKGSPVNEICLAMKKRGFGMGRWNGAGGKVEAGEEIYDAAKREAKEEIDVDIKEARKVAELDFYFPHNSAWDQKVHVYFCQNWDGQAQESEEMQPNWFKVEKIPFDKMWPDDRFWLPEVLSGKLVRASFVFGEGDVVLGKDVSVVATL